MGKELIKNVLPKQQTSVVYKNAKAGTSSFRITKQLLQSIVYKAKRLKTVSALIITIPANKKERYVLRCQVSKEKI